MMDFPFTEGEWTYLGKRTAVHENGALIVHNDRWYYRLEVDAAQDRETAGRNKELHALLAQAVRERCPEMNVLTHQRCDLPQGHSGDHCPPAGKVWRECVVSSCYLPDGHEGNHLHTDEPVRSPAGTDRPGDKE